MSETKQVPMQKTFFDLATFADVTLKKSFDFTPVASVDEALSRLGNDAKRLIEIVNEGLINEQRRTEYQNADGWQAVDEDGDIVGPFTGVPADSKVVNDMVLKMAKYVFGYSKDMTAEQKRAAREQAIEFIKSNETIKAGLQKSAALNGTGD